MKRVLLIENEVDSINQLQPKLEKSGYQVIIAKEGMSGLRKAYQEGPDLIVLEKGLPNFNGYQICALIRRDIRYQDTPIIMLSVCAQDKLENYDGGRPNFIFLKPFNPVDFLAKIAELLAKQDARKEELHQQMIEKDARWMKEHYIPGLANENLLSTVEN
jgi:DNA-binding response OmpR family regulator